MGKILIDGKNVTQEDIGLAIEALSGLEVGRNCTIKNSRELISVLQAILPELELEFSKKEARNKNIKESVKSRWSKDSGAPSAECEMTDRLNDLASDWLASDWMEGLSKAKKSMFNMDGFYPYYTEQPLKILFVGREACWMGGKNYIDVLCKDIQNDKVGSWCVSKYPFQRRLFYMAYGLMYGAIHGKWPQWDEVPSASEMAQSIFARSPNSNIEEINGLHSLSWAFINLSKLSNDTGDWRTDGARYRPFVENKANQKLLCKQINILKPDLIIGANVYDLVKICGYREEPGKWADYDDDNCYYYKRVKSKLGEFPPFLNCYHFAAIKKEKTCFYESVMEVLWKHRKDWRERVKTEECGKKKGI